MVKDITCISLLPTSPPLQKIKKNEKKMPLIYKYSGTDQHAHMILESGMVNTPPPYSCWTSTV